MNREPLLFGFVNRTREPPPPPPILYDPLFTTKYVRLILACKMSFFPKIKKKNYFELKCVWCPLLNCRRFLSWLLSVLSNVYLICCTKWLQRQTLTWRFRLSIRHFCWAAGNIFTQHNVRCKLEHHCSFGLKFNVPGGFPSLRSWLIC